MCIYGMEGPGGYQLFGRTIQVWNTHRQTDAFVDGKPWLLRFFDQIRFFKVDADELADWRRDFPTGRRSIKVEHSEFRLADYRAFLNENAESIAAFEATRQAAFDEERAEWERSGEFDRISDLADAGAAEVAAVEVPRRQRADRGALRRQRLETDGRAGGCRGGRRRHRGDRIDEDGMPVRKPRQRNGLGALHAGTPVAATRYADAGLEAQRMTELTRQSVTAIADAVSSGRTSALAVAEEALARIEAYDEVQPQIWISRASREDVLAAARKVDARIAAGENLPLAGVPYAVKDNIDVAGLKTTAACPAFAYSPERSAGVVDRLEAAGAICVGKTNLDQFATGLVGVRSPYGIPRNVYNRDYVSGGSSSGSSVAVAAGLVPFALGTDTAGSGRVPAAFQHLIGFKPTQRPLEHARAGPRLPQHRLHHRVHGHASPTRGGWTKALRPSIRRTPGPSRLPTGR